MTSRDPITGYIASLVDPERVKSRFPDSWQKPTGLFRSIAQYDIPVWFDPDSSTGFFSVCVQPKLGGFEIPEQYQVAVALPGTAGVKWEDVDWSNASNYATALPEGDPRVDPNFWTMTGVSSTNFYREFEAPTTATYGYNLFENVHASSPALPYPNTGPPILFVENFTAGNWNRILFPKGTYLVTITTSFAGIANILTPLDFVLTGYGTATVNQPFERNSSASTRTANDTIVSTTSFYVDAHSANAAVDVILNKSNATAVLNTDVSQPLGFRTIVTVAAVNTGINNTGIIERIRPVAQSMLVTYTGTKLQDGGQISAAYVDPDYAATCFYNTTGKSQAQDVGSLAILSDNAYNGRLEKGAYCWWAPSVTKDNNFLKVSEMADADYPCMICSGSFTPGPVNPGGVAKAVVRLRVATVFEFQTESTAVDTEKLIGSTLMVDTVNNLLGNQIHAMPNGSHVAWIRQMLRDAMGFINKNPQLISAAATIGRTALALL